ncbi:hypothetical protein Ahy_A08g039870 [Arachis hypogaea]|uniref:Uncharacterized protein n=1 Tax=Arachis hypogaea TaxID=3818 RepID=A0A445BY45_ARAHY|nr:hypothetical protein Ahy_A08g039870 [Arachis hypogaea]
MSEVNLESGNDPMFQTQTDQSSVNKQSSASSMSTFVRDESIKPFSCNTPQPHQAADGTPTEPTAPSKIILYVNMQSTSPSSHCYIDDDGQGRDTDLGGSIGGKSQESPILVKDLEELVEQVANDGVAAALNFAEDRSPSLQKFETPARRSEVSGDLKEKCFLWTTNIKTYKDGSTNEWETMCILNAQQPMEISKIHFASLKADTHIEAEIVTTMCLILNKTRIKRFKE